MRRLQGLHVLTALAAALVLTASAGPVRAGTVEVEFDFSGSSLSILGGLVQVPPDGAITGGSGSLTVPASSAAAPGPGAAQLSDLALAGTFAANTVGVSITGAIGATQPSPVAGALTGGLGAVSLPNPLVLSFTGFANCSGTGCGALSLPTTFNGPQTFTIGALPVGSLANVGNAFVNGTFSFTLDGFTAVLNLVGAEVGRTFVPEPGSFGLVSLGLASLAAHRTVRRARRARAH